MDRNLEYVRKRIKEEVKSRGYTYESFASLFKKTEAWFSHMVNAHRKITLEALFEIAQKLGIDPASLLPGVNPNKKPEFEEYIKSIIDDHMDEKLKKFKEELEELIKK